MFGVSDVDEVEDFDDVDRPVVSPAAAPGSAAEPGAEAAPDELPEDLLDAILAIINAQLPPIASQCIDRNAQLRYLADALGAPLQAYSRQLKQKALSELTGNRKEMQQELEKLRAERNDVTSKREEQKAALLSEQRQRRALNERNHDLEAKIAELDSEIEQHKLTISSLMNKMRVAEVAEGDSAALREEIAILKADIAAKDETIAAKDKELAAMAERIAEAEAPAALEAALGQRRDASADSTAQAPDPASAPKKKRGRGRKPRTDYSAADDSTADLESVDWLLPGGAPAGHTPAGPDPDFGYQPPKQAPQPDSDAQLTLF